MSIIILENEPESIPQFDIVIGTPSLVSDDTELLIPYSAVSQPAKTSNLTYYKYTYDEITWMDMTPSSGTVVTDISLCVNRNLFNFTWMIAEDIPGVDEDNVPNFYNKSIVIKFKINSGDSEAESYTTIYIKNGEVIRNRDMEDIAPLSHNGLDSLDIMKKAPYTL